MKKEPGRPWHPAPYDEFVAASVRSLFEGKASEGQQKRFVDWLLFEVCGVRDLSFRPDSERDTSFAEGKRFVGLQVVKVSKIVPESLKPKRDDERGNRGNRR